jgi:adenylate cyclase
MIYKHLNEPLPRVQANRPEIPEKVDWVIQQATVKEPSRRYPDVSAFASDLKHSIGGLVTDEMVVDQAAPREIAPFTVRAEMFPDLTVQREEERPLFVGRDRELAKLDESIGAVKEANGQVYFITGEAGQGKTALLDEFARRAQSGHPELIVTYGKCNAFSGVGDPYLPFRDIFGMLTGDIDAGWTAGSISKEQARRLLDVLPDVVRIILDEGPDLIDVLIPGPALMKRISSPGSGGSIEEDRLKELLTRKSGQTMDLEQRQIFEQCTKVLHSLSALRPIVIVMDDLQWADGASVNLLFHLGRRLAGSRILVLGAYRPSEVAPGRPSTDAVSAVQTLEPIINEFRRLFGDIHLDLGRFPLTESRAFVDAMLDSEPNDLRESFRSKLFWRTKGHPLFTVELIRDLRERGDLHLNEAGKWEEGPSLDWEKLPARVEAVIEGRVSRLDDELKEILNVASVEGEEFTAEVVAIISGVNQRKLIRWLSSELDRHHRLVIAQGMRRIGANRLSAYRFRHSLFQEYLYKNLDDVERSVLHEDMGGELERLYEGQTDEIAPQLARHFQEAGIHEKAIDYLLQAGNRAIRLSAHPEAINHLTQGLALIKELPEGSDRDDRELTLQIALGVPLQVTTGPGAAEVGKAYSRARELYQRVGQPSQLYPAMWGLWRYYRSRADFQTARDLADELLILTQEVGDPALILQGHHAQWTTLIYLGELREALIHIEKGVALYSPKEHHADASLFSGHDLGVCAHTMASYALWALGYPDQAMDRAKDALKLSEEFNHPSSLALSYEHLAGLHRFRREPLEVQKRAQDLIAIAEEMGSEYDMATGQVMLGWAMAEQGRIEEGLDHIRQGLSKRRPVGTGLEDAHISAVLVETLGKVELFDEGLQLLEELIAAVSRSDQRFWEAEIHRLRGELLARQGRSPDLAAESFQLAIDVARDQEARSLELRAATDLYRLYLVAGETGRHHKLLNEIYASFSEGFDAPDLREARELLESPR